MSVLDTRVSPTSPATALAVPAPATATATAAPFPADRREGRWRLLAVLTIVGASMMDLLDSTIVNIAGPALRRDIGASASALQWIVAGYTLAFACTLITGARLGDVLGRKRMFLTGVAGFVASSVLCSAAVNAQMLITTRVAQGAFAAVMIPQGLGLIRAVYPPQQRARALAVFGITQGMAGKAGPRRMIQAGVAVMTAGLLGTAWTIHHSGVAASTWDLAPALFAAGFGVGLVFAPFFGTVLAAVEDHEVSSASGVVNAIQQLGSALGVAGLGTLFFDRITSHGASAAAAPVFIITAAVLAVAWAIAFAMPKTARADQR